MDQINIFISVGATCTDGQEKFLSTIEHRLKSEGMVPNTVGRNKFGSEAPLKTINDCMDECCGTIVIALERTYFPHGIERRGGPREKPLPEARFPTPWNQIEAAMSYSRKMPLMIIIEEGLRSEGLLEKGYDWYVMWVKPNQESLTTAEFNGVFASWKKKVQAYCQSKTQTTAVRKSFDPSTLTITEIFRNLRTSHLWAIIVALAAIIGLAFTIGRYFAAAE